MSLDVTTVGAVGAPAAPSAVAGDRARPAPRAAPPVVVDTLPDRPPPEVVEAMQAASRALQRLHEQGRELHFDHDGETGVLTIEVRDLDGNLLATIPPSKLLELISQGTAP